MSCLSPWARQNFPALLKIEQSLAQRKENAGCLVFSLHGNLIFRILFTVPLGTTNRLCSIMVELPDYVATADFRYSNTEV